MHNLQEGEREGALTDFLVPPLRSPSAFGDNAVTRFADGDECPSCLPCPRPPSLVLALALIPSFLLPSSSVVLSIRRFR